MSNQSSNDQIQRFTFANLPIRGEIISLNQSYQQICDQHQHPVLVRHLMGEALAANALMTEIIKIQGKVALQLQSPVFLKLLLTECNDQGHVRGLMHTNTDFSENNLVENNLAENSPAEPSEYQFADWTKGGQMAITIEPEKGQRYQGVVPLEQATLAACIEEYFTLSEQLPTYLKLFVDDQRVTGIFLQALPESGDDLQDQQQAFEHVSALAETLKPEEALELSHDELLYRLFHQDEVTLYPAKSLKFQCSCSRERNEAALMTIGNEELMELVKEQAGKLELVCDFCSNKEIFSEQDVINLLTTNQGNQTIN